MQFNVNVEQGTDGGWVATCGDMGCQAAGLSETNALDRLRDEIRYRLEYCPCSGVEEDYIELKVCGL